MELSLVSMSNFFLYKINMLIPNTPDLCKRMHTSKERVKEKHKKKEKTMPRQLDSQQYMQAPPVTTSILLKKCSPKQRFLKGNKGNGAQASSSSGLTIMPNVFDYLIGNVISITRQFISLTHHYFENISLLSIEIK